MPTVDDAKIPHRFIAVEGPIGVGKTTLAKKLAQRFNYNLLLEQAEENPFLSRFYENPKRYALATQLFFLFQRSQQLEDSPGQDFFSQPIISDFLMAKDPLFAEVNLAADELQLYRKVYDQLTLNMPKPDLVIYLQASEGVLDQRITQRGVAAEQNIDHQYLQELNGAYQNLFHYYDESPLLIVNAEQIDFANNEAHLEHLISFIGKATRGKLYLNPSFFNEAL